MNKVFYILSALSIIITLLFPILHDYVSYENQWSITLSGQSPWIGTGNAYGITYNFFGIFYGIYNKLPRVLFVLTYLAAVYFILTYCQSIKFKKTNAVLYIFMLNPLFWIFCVAYGSNDSFLAGITSISIIALIHFKPKIAGILLAIGSNFKFTPLFIIPFLVLEKKVIDYKLIIAFIITTVVIVLSGFILWGTDIINPFIFGAERPSKVFSIFRFIRGEFQPLSFIGVNNIDHFSIYFMLFSWILSLIIYVRYSFDKYLMILFSFSNILLFYKVGHHQFFILLLFLTILAYVKNYETIKKDKPLKISLIIFWAWLFIFTVLFPLTNHYAGNYNFINEFVGGPFFFIHLTMNGFIIRHLIKYSNLKNEFKEKSPYV